MIVEGRPRDWVSFSDVVLGLAAGLSDGCGCLTGADSRIEGVTSWQHRKASAPQRALRLTGGLPVGRRG